MTTRKKNKRVTWNATELASKTAKYDGEFIEDSFGDMTPEARKRWLAAKRKRGRPKVGDGAHRISVTIEKGLLSKADKLAKKLDVTRAALISRGLTLILNEENGK